MLADDSLGQTTPSPIEEERSREEEKQHESLESRHVTLTTKVVLPTLRAT